MAEGVQVCRCFSALLSDIMHMLLLHYFSLFNPVLHACFGWGVQHTHLQIHTVHSPHHIIHITPSSFQWTYCLNYNQTKCTYGCTCPPPPSSSLLSVQSRFFPWISLLPCFLPNSSHQNAVSSPLFLSFQRNGTFPIKAKKNVPFKIHSRMSLLVLTDLSLSKGHKLFLQACQSRVNGFT